MRLLNVQTLRLEDFDPGSIPDYVIASHRWSRGQETSFQDVLARQNIEKSGYKKVVGFADFIKKHSPHVQWLWIDTCCIDKTNNQEVSEAVNSMFRWYSEVQLCLAYLPDVETLEIEDFIETEWFKRGWTLQELLAPSTVVFLTSDWQVIGHKCGEAAFRPPSSNIGRSLERAISSVTKIPVSILKDFEQSRALSVDEKLSWTLGRTTTREEDMSYCLFGILDVAIGANYGEGGQRARRRLLKEVSELQHSHASETQATAGAAGPPTDLAIRQHSGVFDQQEMLQKAMESLNFPQMEDRREHIHRAYQDTYRWILQSTPSENTKWDSFISWLREPEPRSRIYWISAKPGAGKSSLVKFLDGALQVDVEMQPWAEGKSVLFGTYYFWNPGQALQKTLTGLLRTIIYQLFEQSPETVFSCLPNRKRMQARSASTASDISWTDLELRQCLRKYVSMTSSSSKLFLLIDGLDEVDGDEEDRDDLIAFLKELAASPHIKLCVSSRRWAIFGDSFASCPQLRLENLNYRDIATYVQGQLMRQPRYEQMLAYDMSASRLVYDVIRKAQGVFLWTRLVVKELIRGIRDGDNYLTLREKLAIMPDDLDAYFARLLDSIEPYHRREACVLLQIALFHEREFTTLHPLRLLDLIFIQDAATDFALSGPMDVYIRSFSDAEELFYRLDGTLSRLSSLCKGLLECHFHGGSALNDFVIKDYVACSHLAAEWQNDFWEGTRGSPRTLNSLPSSLLPILRQHKYAAFDLRIDFMHRSLRDYLLRPERMQLLVQHTGGLFDCRNYLRNARLVEMFMVTSAGLSSALTLGLASYYISTLSVHEFRKDPRCADHVMTFRPLIDSSQGLSNADGASFWYICRSIRTWFREKGNFWTLAVDFGLTAYLTRSLTSAVVQQKAGRPLLDCVLRPRFSEFLAYGDVSIGLQFPDPDLVRLMLSLGADQNGLVEGISLWPLFLSFIAEQDALCIDYEPCPKMVNMARTHYSRSLEIMIKAGASTIVRRHDLSRPFMYGMFATSTKQQSDNFNRRWPGVRSRPRQHAEDVEYISVSEALRCLEPVLGAGVFNLSKMAQMQR